MPDNKKYAWDQLEDETTNEYNMFLEYLHQGQPRHMSKLYDKFNVSRATLNRWKDKNDWYGRAAAFDELRGAKLNEIEMERGLTVKDYRMRVIKEEVEDYSLLRQAWIGGLSRLLEDNEQTPSQFMSSLSQATYVRNILDGMARRAVELPNNISKKIEVASNENEEIAPDEIQLTMNGPKFLMDNNDDTS